MDLEAAHATSRYLAGISSEVVGKARYRVYRTREFPGYYDGNFMDILSVGSDGLSEWIARYDAHFDEDTYAHVSVRGLDGSGIRELAGPSVDHGFEGTRYIYLFADERTARARGAFTDPRRGLPAGLTIRRVDSDARWQLLRAFDDREQRDQPWYTPEVADMLHTVKRRRSSIVEWLYVSPSDRDEILAKLGLFECRVMAGRDDDPSAAVRACRLQDVTTAIAHRRRGLCSALLREALDQAILTRRTRGLFVCADASHFAIDIYRSHGFVDVGGYTHLFRQRDAPPRARPGGA